MTVEFFPQYCPTYSDVLCILLIRICQQFFSLHVKVNKLNWGQTIMRWAPTSSVCLRRSDRGIEGDEIEVGRWSRQSPEHSHPVIAYDHVTLLSSSCSLPTISFKMKNPTGFSALPTELIHSIFGRLELKDLIVLCRTDHQIHANCLGWIYRSITLESPVQVLKCCKSVISRKEAADAVRELKMYVCCAM
jgi:hypothetical protein